MKKVLVLAMAAFFVSGVALANHGGHKKCGKGKNCCKKEAKSCCKKATSNA